MTTRTRRIAVTSAAATAATAALALIGSPVHAATVNHNPVGYLDSAKGVGLKHGMQLKGWADDPDSTKTPLKILVSVDNAKAKRYNSGKPRPDVQKVHPTFGPNQGYSITIYTTPGIHKVCVTAVNIGAGVNSLLRCANVTVK
jgi:hypothetical protein